MSTAGGTVEACYEHNKRRLSPAFPLLPLYGDGEAAVFFFFFIPWTSATNRLHTAREGLATTNLPRGGASARHAASAAAAAAGGRVRCCTGAVAARDLRFFVVGRARHRWSV